MDVEFSDVKITSEVLVMMIENMWEKWAIAVLMR